MSQLSQGVAETGGSKHIMAKIVITISGLHGVGKSTYAEALSKAFKVRHVSAGELFRGMAKSKGMDIIELTRHAEGDPKIDRLIDNTVKGEAERGSVILDGVLTGWMVPYADIKIFLDAPLRARIRRIAQRDGISLEKARRRTLIRERAERERFHKYYGINLDDKDLYDLVIDTNLLPKGVTIKLLEEIIREHVKSEDE